MHKISRNQCSLSFYLYLQCSFGENATDDRVTTVVDARRGGIPTSMSIDPKMMTDIQIAVSRLIGKASQLLGNFATNVAETWMHMRINLMEER